MKKIPLRIFDFSVTKDWGVERFAEYEMQINHAIRYWEMRGEPLTIEYVDENLNVLKTLELEGDKNKSLEYQKTMKKLLKGVLK